MAEQQRDVVEVLMHDHREVEGMFTQLESTTNADQRADLVEQVTIELVRHSVAEEQWLYPAVRDTLPDGDGLAGQACRGGGFRVPDQAGSARQARADAR